MKNFTKILFLTLFVILANGFKAHAGPTRGKDTDTASSLKSNIAVFKMMTSPAATNSSSKSLKKAGSVARTSNSHTTITPVKPVPEG